ncbi:MAG: hypothetical protein ACAF41_13325 [Leptolyngbya sp. BL-A-14]
MPPAIRGDRDSQHSFPFSAKLQAGIATLASAPAQATVHTSSAPASVKGQFTSPKQASQFLEAIAKTLSHRCKTIRLEVELEDATMQPVCQEWLNQYLGLSKN